ncbi:MAG: hypothetical protein ABL911_04530 [Gallionella sp.]|nr:hypothetical protein [Gallionella sp.]
MKLNNVICQINKTGFGLLVVASLALVGCGGGGGDSGGAGTPSGLYNVPLTGVGATGNYTMTTTRTSSGVTQNGVTVANVALPATQALFCSDAAVHAAVTASIGFMGTLNVTGCTFSGVTGQVSMMIDLGIGQGYTTPGSVNFSYAATPAASNPGITGVTPSGSGIGTSVTITGTNFRQGSGGILSGDAYRVSFNGATATPNGRTLTQLAVIVPAGATTGALTVTDLITNQVYNVPGGFMVTGQPSQTFIAIPANGVFTAAANNVAVDFADITGAVVTVNATDIIFDITLRNLPATFTFNQPNVPLNQREYEWAVDFDINNDSLQDYSLSLSSFKSTDQPGSPVSTPIVQPLLKGKYQVNVWNKNNYLVGASASVTGNTIRLSVPKSAHTALLNITPAAMVNINTWYRSDSTTLVTDSI